MHSSVALLAAIAAGAVAKTITIDAGEGGLIYNPNTVTADVGDVIEFHFYGAFHTAVQGDFNTPCQRGPLGGSGFNSGPIHNQADGSVCLFLALMPGYCLVCLHANILRIICPLYSANSLGRVAS